MNRAKENIKSAQDRQSHYANQNRREVTYSVGDRVMLSTENLNMRGAGGDMSQTFNHKRTSKLLPKYIGPYPISRVISSVAYELILPPSMHIHPVFHVSKLKSYIDGQLSFPHRPHPVSRPPPDVLPDGIEEYEVECILNKRTIRVGRSSRPVTQYLIKWKGYPDHESTWEPLANLDHAQEAIREYEQEEQRRRDRMSVRHL